MPRSQWVLRAQAVNPDSPSKEYVRVGGRVVAIENGPTASFTISKNGGAFTHSVTASVGDTIAYKWTSTGGNSYSSYDTITPNGRDGCGNNSGSAGFNTASGTTPAYALIACQSGYTYTMSYTVRASNGEVASDTIVIIVR